MKLWNYEVTREAKIAKLNCEFSNERVKKSLEERLMLIVNWVKMNEFERTNQEQIKK